MYIDGFSQTEPFVRELGREYRVKSPACPTIVAEIVRQLPPASARMASCSQSARPPRETRFRVDGCFCAPADTIIRILLSSAPLPRV